MPKTDSVMSKMMSGKVRFMQRKGGYFDAETFDEERHGFSLKNECRASIKPNEYHIGQRGF